MIYNVLFYPVVRPGTCPVGLLPEGVAGACYEGCHDDVDCSTNQKCCSNGCGHTCITVIEDPGNTNSQNRLNLYLLNILVNNYATYSDVYITKKKVNNSIKIFYTTLYVFKCTVTYKMQRHHVEFDNASKTIQKYTLPEYSFE